MRKSLALKKGRLFAAAGWGRYGPYAVGTYRYKRAVAKLTAGTKGSTVGGRVRVYKHIRVCGEYNLSHKSRALEVRIRRKKFRLEA
ncbi:MAG: hypothetical protein ABSF83_01535 [Nitrososphaerales archaeon]|jgi:hypothetical protein